MLQQFFETLQMQWSEHWSAWAIFGGILLITWLSALLAKVILKGIVTSFTARSSTTLDDRLVEAAVGPLRFLVMTLGLRLALGSLGENIATLGQRAEFTWVEKGAAALVILAVTSVVNRLLRAGIRWYLHELALKSEGTWDKDLLPVFERLLTLVLYFIAVTIIVESFGGSITALVTTAGVASLAVALAAQETLSNMIGGFVILVDRPFKVGDVIELGDGKVGEVVEIGLRSSRIKLFDGNAVVMPNKDLASTQITNFALPTPRAAIRQTIGVDYGVDIELAKSVLMDVIKAHPEVLSDPEPGIWFTNFGESSLNLFMSCWVESYRDRFRITDELNIQILKAFREANIGIPFPQRDVHLYVKDSGVQGKSS
jgi:MscS family membrane protein